jgi:hypothetical protein
MAGGKQIVLDLQIVDHEIDGKVIVGEDAADLGGRQEDFLGTFAGEKGVNGVVIG